MIRRRLALIGLLLPLFGKVDAGQVNAEVNLTIQSTGGLRSSGYLTYTSIFGNSTSEHVSYVHFIQNYDAYSTGQGNTPLSNVIHSGTAPTPPFCYRAKLDATADDSEAHGTSDDEFCYDGPPSPGGGTDEPNDGCPASLPNCNNSPILLDIGGTGYHLTSVTDGVLFDLRNEGRRIHVAWTRADKEIAFLALDRNGDGRIDNGSELFGNATPLRSGALAANGFVALAEFDDNQDLQIDSIDAAWAVLLLWTDRNHDGKSQPDELQPIADSDVMSLATDYRTIRRRDPWGNVFRYASKFLIEKHGVAHKRVCYDVLLSNQQ